MHATSSGTMAIYNAILLLATGLGQSTGRAQKSERSTTGQGQNIISDRASAVEVSKLQ